MNSVFAVRNDEGTLTFFPVDDKTYTTTKVDDDNAWTNEREGGREAKVGCEKMVVP